MTETSDSAAAGGAGLIRLEDLSKRFGETVVFDDLTLGFHRGHTTVVLGQSGVGKSVMLKLILGILRPDEGRVIIEGEDITDLPERKLVPIRCRFGMVFQEAALFDYLSVYENVAFGLREHTDKPEDEIRDIVAEKLALVDLDGTEELYPEELSGGMRKRVGLARAIAMDPRVVLYDEPTSGLDPVTADTIQRMMERTKERLSATNIVVTHDMTSAYRLGDRLVMLDRGNIIADGTVEEFKAHTDVRVQRFIRGNAELTEDEVAANQEVDQ